MAAIKPYRDVVIGLFVSSPTTEVVVTATPNWTPPPESTDYGIKDLSAVRLNDTKVHLTWKNGENVTATMVRASMSGYPQSQTDGWQVFYGDAQKADDTGINMDVMLGTVYYTGWSENATGDWFGDYAQAKVENPYMTEIANLLDKVLPLGVGVFILTLLSILSFWKPNVVNCLLPAGLSAMVGFFAFDASNTALGLSLTLILFLFSFYNLGRALAMMFQGRDE